MAYLPNYLPNKKKILDYMTSYKSNKIKKYFNGSTIIVCVGSDLLVADSLGPVVGTLLKERNLPFPVFGTLNRPIEAQNYKKVLRHINEKYPNSTIIAIDACICKPEQVGHIFISTNPVRPGKGIGKQLPTIGNLSILAGVCPDDTEEPFINRKVRLSLVWKMAYTIAYIIEYCLEEYTKNCPDYISKEQEQFLYDS
ncbi:putative sporulation protein YyaC [Hathewaya proteolytica DSM 3090]|uniref:Putative sporulation protein YyaC n=1 Tax=Hathewaya proteolytica DSM 3090 TaxID=1121331 RepID=A0A1M6S9Y1_9CLOT|nr:spore protease YyaC [Hathewaya proteolytica]SHK41470.1 putative sporulation protein YyaC [Hathewaya proteolytica DSM 3090]